VSNPIPIYPQGNANDRIAHQRRAKVYEPAPAPPPRKSFWSAYWPMAVAFGAGIAFTVGIDQAPYPVAVEARAP